MTVCINDHLHVNACPCLIQHLCKIRLRVFKVFFLCFVTFVSGLPYVSVAEHLPLHRLELWCPDGVSTSYFIVMTVGVGCFL